ncbi:hypothetical protein BG006_003829, partial [Podila minutissima]
MSASKRQEPVFIAYNPHASAAAPSPSSLLPSANTSVETLQGKKKRKGLLQQQEQEQQQQQDMVVMAQVAPTAAPAPVDEPAVSAAAPAPESTVTKRRQSQQPKAKELKAAPAEKQGARGSRGKNVSLSSSTTAPPSAANGWNRPTLALPVQLPDKPLLTMTKAEVALTRKESARHVLQEILELTPMTRTIKQYKTYFGLWATFCKAKYNDNTTVTAIRMLEFF